VNSSVDFVPMSALKQRSTDVSEAVAALIGRQLVPLKVGEPFLVSATSGAPIQPFLYFMREKGRGWMAATRDAYVDDLLDFANFLDAHELEIRDITVDTLQDYVFSHSEVPSSATGRPFAAETISRRLSTAKAFAIWASGRGFLDERLSTSLQLIQIPIQRDELAHLGPQSTVALDDAIDEPKKLCDDEHVQVLSLEDSRQLLDELGSLPREWRHCQPGEVSSPVKNRLMAELSLATGLRRTEVCRLELRQVTRVVVDPEVPLRQYTLSIVRKGGQRKKFFVPGWMVFSLQQYAIGERRDAIESARRLSSTFEEPPCLFVNGLDARRNRGGALNPKSLDRIFSTAQARLGMLSLTGRDSGKLGQELARYRFHDLRHTYAIWTYLARKAAGDSEPWIFISRQLGHRNLSTTIRIYLNPAKAAEATASTAFYRELRELERMYG